MTYAYDSYMKSTEHNTKLNEKLFLLQCPNIVKRVKKVTHTVYFNPKLV